MLNTKQLQPIHWDKLIRLGRDNDGGYILPEELVSTTKSILSYGVNKDWSLEKSFYNLNPNVHIHGYDHTLSLFSLFQYTLKCCLLSILYILTFDKKRLKKTLPGIVVIPDYFLFLKGKCKHFRNRIWKDRSEDSKTLEDTIEALPKESQSSIFLKMDIEGAEYLVIDSILKHAEKFNLLAIEFHDIEKNLNLFNSSVQKLKEFFHILHIHGNNYSQTISEQGFTDTMELTFIEKSYCHAPVSSKYSYPIKGLDHPNKISRPDAKLIF